MVASWEPPRTGAGGELIAWWRETVVFCKKMQQIYRVRQLLIEIFQEEVSPAIRKDRTVRSTYDSMARPCLEVGDEVRGPKLSQNDRRGSTTPN